MKGQVGSVLLGESGAGQLEDEQSEPVAVTVSVLKWCSSCMQGRSGKKKSHRLGKDFRGQALCFPLPAAASSKGEEGL